MTNITQEALRKDLVTRQIIKDLIAEETHHLQKQINNLHIRIVDHEILLRTFWERLGEFFE